MLCWLEALLSRVALLLSGDAAPQRLLPAAPSHGVAALRGGGDALFSSPSWPRVLDALFHDFAACGLIFP